MSDRPDGSLWYPMSAMRRARAAVRLHWNGRVFEATKLWCPHTGRYEFAVLDMGDLVWLPPKDEDWGEPSAWQPIHAKWPDPLPEPLKSAPDRMWSSTMKFALVDEASAADLAREMEDDRKAARASSGVERFDPERVQWWRDASQVKYEPLGEVTAKNMEGRMMRAVAHAGTGLGLTLVSRTVGQVLADMATAADRAFGVEDPRSSYVPKFHQLPRDQDDFDEAMRWFTELNPPNQWHHRREPWSLNRLQRVLVFRSLNVPWSYDDIGQDIGRTGERARQLHKEALQKALKIANSKPGRSADIEALRQRNRAHKQKESG